jgi:hypothetical protein
MTSEYIPHQEKCVPHQEIILSRFNLEFDENVHFGQILQPNDLEHNNDRRTTNDDVEYAILRI